MLTAAEFASIPVRGDGVDDAGATTVILTFATATVLSVAGYILLAVASARAGRWTGWRRRAPLVAAVASVAVLGMSFSPTVLPAGVAVWSLGLLVLCAATYSDPVPVAPAPATRGAAPEVRLPGRPAARPAGESWSTSIACVPVASRALSALRASVWLQTGLDSGS
ncbi:hypothetical protein I6A84_16890 [Frankia sp. CNm7]|uniref:hypothetical protein n=1 Tax=Frankia nepalensis TaxID=1836974 RepID=UPI00193263D0|nr:hypothetical protein [Frankia nepalensis]MBL7519730.1 hypothetical protein [Frankia nepalensis]